jgi:hypothetical protein
MNQQLPLYQIVEWNDNFENNKSRQRDRCSYVCIPNKLGGVGQTTILGQPNGAALLCIFELIVKYCSRQRAPRMGYLTADGKPDGWRLGSEQLSHMLRVSASDIRRCLLVVSSPGVGWCKLVDGVPEVAEKAVIASDSTVDTASDRQVTAETDTASDRQVTAETDTPSVSTPDTLRKKERKNETPCNPPEGGIAREQEFTFEQARDWINNLFGRRTQWSYDENFLLHKLLPIPKRDRALLSWGYKLPRDIDGWALWKGRQLEKPKHHMLRFLREFGSEVEKWRAARAQVNGAEPKPEVDDRLPPEWAEAMRKMYGEDATIPSQKKYLPASVIAEIEEELQHASQTA